jgi:hypothetical protein
MWIIGPLLLLVGGVIALSGFIASKKPNAKELLDKLTPIAGFIGVGLLVWGIIDLIRSLDMLGTVMGASAFRGIIFIVYLASEILLGFLLGMGLIAKWMPGEGAVEKKGVEMQKKLTAWQVPIGFIGIICALLVVLMALRVF